MSVLIKLILRAGSGDPQPSLSYAALGSGCTGTSQDTLNTSSPLPSLHSTCVQIPLLHVIALGLLFSIIYLCPVYSPFFLFCFPLTPSWSQQRLPLSEPGSVGGFLPVKREFSPPSFAKCLNGVLCLLGFFSLIFQGLYFKIKATCCCKCSYINKIYFY